MGQRFRGYCAVCGGHRCHLPLQQLQDHIYISCHPGLQSLEREGERERERKEGVVVRQMQTLHFKLVFSLYVGPVELRLEQLQAGLQLVRSVFNTGAVMVVAGLHRRGMSLTLGVLTGPAVGQIAV